MKILLDESLPRKLKNDFGLEHQTWTVRDKGWLSKKNGELLKLTDNKRLCAIWASALWPIIFWYC
jgi:predicted nuclease of predicted toxin-antitoxin system